MKRYFVSLFGLPDSSNLYDRLHALTYDDYVVAGRPHTYEVMWEHKDPIQAFIPEIPSDHISQFLETL